MDGYARPPSKDSLACSSPSLSDRSVNCSGTRSRRYGVKPVSYSSNAKIRKTIPYLFDILQDPSPEVQQGAMELLSVVGDASTVQAAVTTCADTPAIR